MHWVSLLGGLKKFFLYVGQYGNDGELIKVYDSVREAKKVASGVPLVLSGDRKRAGGYMWKYMDN